MSRPIIKEHNLTTGEIIEREMTDAEFDVYEKEAAEEARRISQATEKNARRAEILERLGLTEDDAKLLLS